MQNTKNFFKAQFFTPFACTILMKFSKLKGEIPFIMYESNSTIEFNIPGFRVFLPKNILNSGYNFGRINSDKKKVILNFTLSEENLINLIRELGGTIKKVNPTPSTPKLGDLLK